MTAWSILVGYDGSDHANDALDFGHELATALGARLIAACVYPFRPLTRRLGSGDRAQSIVSAARARVGSACDTRIVPGTSVAEGLRRLADDEDLTVVVLGSRHRGRLGEALPGTTAKALLAGGRHLVATVPHGHRADAIRHIGVLTDDTPEGRAAARASATMADQAHAELRIHEQLAAASFPGSRGPLADDVARGTLDLLVVPAWPHGLLGRLRRRRQRTRLPREARCPVIIVPADALMPVAGGSARDPALDGS